MAASIPPIKITRSTWIDIYAATGIAVGSKLKIQNVGQDKAIICESVSMPPRQFGEAIARGESWESVNNPIGLWAFSSLSTSLQITEKSVLGTLYLFKYVGTPYIPTEDITIFTLPAGNYKIEWTLSSKAVTGANLLVCSGGWGDWNINKGHTTGWGVTQFSMNLRCDGTACLLRDFTIDSSSGLTMTATLIG